VTLDTNFIDPPVASMTNTLVAVGAGRGDAPRVEVRNAVTGTVQASFFAFDPAFMGGVSVAMADVNGDGVADLILGAGPGGGPHVKVVDGTKLNQLQANGEIADSALLASFFAYDAGFTGGVFVAAGNVTSDNTMDIITGAGPGGGPHVKVFRGTDLAVLQSFMAYDPTFTGGVNVAAADFDGDGKPDIITGAGPGGGPHVKVFRGTDLKLLASYFAYNPSFTGGVFVAARDLDGDGHAEILTGAGSGGGSQVEVFRGADLTLLDDVFAFDPLFQGGVFVG
jgi:hypothetical protein